MMTDQTKKQKVTARVVSQERLAEDIMDIVLETAIARGARPGQFVGLYPPGKDLLLPRPISICDAGETMLRLVYRIAGRGTARLASLRRGEETDLIGLLGNGFPADAAEGKDVLIFGGGIGIPPMRFLAKTLSVKRKDGKGTLTSVMGYRDGDCFLAEEFASYGRTLIATEDGSRGTKGNVLDAVRAEGIRADICFACGPAPMLRAVKAFAAEQHMEAYLSLEERMACGVGVCLGCVCPTASEDAHSHVKNARVCTDGPVFAAEEVLL